MASHNLLVYCIYTYRINDILDMREEDYNKKLKVGSIVNLTDAYFDMRGRVYNNEKSIPFRGSNRFIVKKITPRHSRILNLNIVKLIVDNIEHGNTISLHHSWFELDTQYYRDKRLNKILT